MESLVRELFASKSIGEAVQMAMSLLRCAWAYIQNSLVSCERTDVYKTVSP